MKIGDKVVLLNSESEVKKKLSESGYRWSDQMLGKLGKEFTILGVWQYSNYDIIAIPSPDGSQNGMWYFPKSVLYKSGNDAPH